MPKKKPIGEEIFRAAMAYPEATEDHPWGETVAKVRGKVFLFSHWNDEGYNLSVKLPRSGEAALLLPFAKPTGYGLGKSGWVSCQFAAKDEVPRDLILEWLDESYRAIAPKKLAATLDPSPPEPKAPAKKKKAAAKPRKR